MGKSDQRKDINISWASACLREINPTPPFNNGLFLKYINMERRRNRLRPWRFAWISAISAGPFSGK
jgi:hypothetical protein